MKDRIIRILYYTFVALIFIFAVWVVQFITGKSSRLDFRVFYGAGMAAVTGNPIHTVYGVYMNPFWYFPWLAWIFIPFTALTLSQAWFVYVILCCLLLWGVLSYFSNTFHVTRQNADKIFIYSAALLLCMMLFNFGQINIIVLGLATLVIILLERGKNLTAGVVLPLVLLKPHLLIVFVVACLVKGGKRTFIGAAISSLVMFGIEFLLDPNWLNNLLKLFAYGSRRTEKLYWGHTTLPRLLGFQENYVGTANIPVIALMILLGVLLIWKFRNLPPSQLIAFSLTASLFSAPRAFGYDLILLFPAMLLLSENFNWKTILCWLLAVSIAFAYNFSTGVYILTLLVFGLSIWKLQLEAAYYQDMVAVQSSAQHNLL